MMTESEMKQLLQQDGKKVEAALQELLPDDAISAWRKADSSRIGIRILQDVRRYRRTGNAGCCCN